MIKSLYFASPFFTPEQVEREERLKGKLRELGFEVFSPKEMCHLPKNATIEEQTKVFEGNLTNMHGVDAVFAVTDGKDIGTIWETGYAYAIRKPIIYYCETLGNGVFNIMLARSGVEVITNYEDVTYEKISMADELTEDHDYKGLIQ